MTDFVETLGIALVVDGRGDVWGFEVEEKVGFFRVEEGQSSERTVCVVSCVVRVDHIEFCLFVVEQSSDLL